MDQVLSPCCKAAITLHRADGRNVACCATCFREVTQPLELLKAK
jgi:hypothetical protein